MPVFHDVTEIAAWQLAHRLNLRVDLFLLSPDFKRHYRRADQLSDAVRSGPRNIAEGFGRYHHREFAHFVRIAKASEAEVLNHLIDAQDQRLITADEFQITEHLTARAIKSANSLIRYLESTPDSLAPQVPLAPLAPTLRHLGTLRHLRHPKCQRGVEGDRRAQ
jgi:four helix bundle protein